MLRKLQLHCEKTHRLKAGAIRKVKTERAKVAKIITASNTRLQDVNAKGRGIKPWKANEVGDGKPPPARLSLFQGTATNISPGDWLHGPGDLAWGRASALRLSQELVAQLRASRSCAPAAW